MFSSVATDFGSWTIIDVLMNGLFKYTPGDQGASVEGENNIF